jgi:hypothetical protein
MITPVFEAEVEFQVVIPKDTPQDKKILIESE